MILPSPPRLLLPRRRLAGLLGLLAVAACTSGGDLPPLVEAKPGPYRLDSGDLLRITVFGEEQLTGEFRVSDSGAVTVPLAGPVQAKGLTTSELAAAIQHTMVERKLYRNPQVSVEVVTYRPIFVLGEVSKPGEYAYRPHMTVLTAVAVAGGFTYRAVEDYASILRTAPDGSAVESKATRQSLVQPGDVVTIFEQRL